MVGGLEVVDEGAGGVLAHERTTPKASTDRLELTRATGANLSPIWGLSLARGLTALLADPAEAVGAVIVDGVEHGVERVSDAERIEAIADHLGGDDVLIADGHHRYGVESDLPRRGPRRRPAAATRRPRRRWRSSESWSAEQLSIEAIHRLYTGMPFAELRAALGHVLRAVARPAPDPGGAGGDDAR